MSADPHDRPALDPDAVAGQAFNKVRKGYEVDEVRAFLVGLSSKIREAQQRTADLERRLVEVEKRAADPRELDEETVSQLLGEETARVLEMARKAAADIRSRAEEASVATLTAAEEQARSTREGADQYADGVRSSIDETADRIRAEADEYAQELRASVDAETDARRSAADEYDTQVRGTADAEVAELRVQTTADSERMRAEAETVLADRTAEAETAASAIQAEVDTYAARIRSDADRYAEATRSAADTYRADVQGAADAYRSDAGADGDRIRAEATEHSARSSEEAEAAAKARLLAADAEVESILDQAREQGRSMVEEARSYRERVIADLTDRRRAARAEVEGLAATRDALAVTLTDVSSQITQSHRALQEVAIDPHDVGDTTVDRRMLEADDSTDPSEALELNESGETDQDGPVDLGEAGDGGEMPPPAEAADSVTFDVVEVDETGEVVVVEEAAIIDEEPAGVHDAEPAGVDNVDTESVDRAAVEPAEADETGGEPESDADDPASALFARLRADQPTEDQSEPVREVDSGGTHDLGEAQATGDAELQATVGEAPVDGETDSSVDPDGETAEDSDPDVDLLDRRDAATDAVERQLARRLKRVLSDEQNETLDLLRRTKGSPTAGDVLPSDADHQERYRAAALDDLSEAERAGAAFFGDAPKRRADVLDVAGEFATEIQRQIRAKLERAFEDGGDEDELGERIRSTYREWKTNRIAETARHYVVVAFSRGVAEAAGDDLGFRWLVDDGDMPCPDCDDNSLAGAVTKGEPFPTGDLCPPAHPGCRCLTVPVTAD